MSHLGAGCENLCEALYENPLIDWHKPNVIFNHPEVVYSLSLQPHKSNDAAAIWIKEILYNHYFNHKTICKMCSFIYLIREPRGTLNSLIKAKNQIDPITRYYIFRLRRLYEMARHTPNALLVNYEDMMPDLIQDYLELKEPISVKVDKKEQYINIPKESMDSAERVYDKYSVALRELLS